MSSGASDADPTAALAAHWNESERRLYPTATTNPDAYQSAVRLVRAVADALSDVSDPGNWPSAGSTAPPFWKQRSKPPVSRSPTA